jgi:unspecific monooxygenase
LFVEVKHNFTFGKFDLNFGCVSASIPNWYDLLQLIQFQTPVIPILFPCISKSSIKIAGYEFDAETTPSIYLVHYQEDLYPNAKQFKPERFMGRQYSAGEYLPFGGGSRRCLGHALAQLEMKLVLATVLSKYQLVLAEDKPVKLQRRGFTLAPAGGVRMMITGKRL